MSKTLEKEISAIGRQFDIPVQKIKEVLAKSLKKILEEKDSKKKNSLLPFDGFEQEYVLAKNEEQELMAIKKFLPSCRNANDTKLLFSLCPENKPELQKEIIHEWIVLCKDLSELREPKRLVEKDTPDSQLAYQKYKELFF